MLDESDPRTTGEYVRRCPGGADVGDVILAGVVHGHPASTFRVQSVVDAVDPAVLALELPPMAVPLYERAADNGHTPPASGGEMSAAIKAGTSPTVVGIDGPTPTFLWRLAGDAYRSGVGLSTVRSLASGVASVTRHAITCRLAAAVDEASAVRSAVHATEEYDCNWGDPPREQAADERAQIRRTRAVQTVFGESTAVRLRDDAREAHMAERLGALRQDGTAVAVVGVGHLEPLVDRLV